MSKEYCTPVFNRSPPAHRAESFRASAARTAPLSTALHVSHCAEVLAASAARKDRHCCAWLRDQRPLQCRTAQKPHHSSARPFLLPTLYRRVDVPRWRSKRRIASKAYQRQRHRCKQRVIVVARVESYAAAHELFEMPRVMPRVAATPNANVLLNTNAKSPVTRLAYDEAS